MLLGRFVFSHLQQSTLIVIAEASDDSIAMFEVQEQADFALNDIIYGVNLQEDDALIAIMGMIGVEKSTFINRCVGGEGAIVGHDLQACTNPSRNYGIKLTTEADRLL